MSPNEFLRKKKITPQIRDMDEIKYIPANQLYGIMVKGMQVCAIYFPKGTTKCKLGMYWLYFMAVSCFIWSSVARQLVVLMRAKDSSSILVSLGIFTYYIGMAYLISSSCYSITKHMTQYFKNIDEYRRVFGEFLGIKKLRIAIRIGIGTYFILVPLISLLIASSFYIDFIWINIKDQLYPFTKDTTLDSALLGVYMFFASCYIASVCTLIITFMMSVNRIISSEVNQLNYHMERLVLSNRTEISFDVRQKMVEEAQSGDNILWKNNLEPEMNLDTIKSESDVNTNDGLEIMRKRYECLLQILLSANDVLQHFLFSIFGMAIPVTCIVLYVFIKEASGHNPKLAFIGGTDLNLFSMLCWALFSGAYVASKMKQPLEYMMKLDTRTFSVKSLTTVSMLSVRFLSPHIGYTVYGLFNIDTTTILTLFGTLLTYAILVYQFTQTSEAGFNSTNNCTC